jgi:zinc transport system substrate-binding protein
MLLPSGSESHSYEPTPQDIITIQNCDVFIYVGGESDAWVEDILSSMGASEMQVVTLMDCVQPVEEELIEGMQESVPEKPVIASAAKQSSAPGQLPEVEYDEHVWTAPKNAELIVQKISDAIQAKDPANAATYKQNTQDYIAKLGELDAAFREVTENAARNEIIVGDRFPFRYMCDAYDLKYYAAFPGCATETEASAATVAFLIDKVKEDGIPVIFHLELSNKKIAETIAEATGAKAMQLNACHNITKQNFESGATYLDLMYKNAEALKIALN